MPTELFNRHYKRLARIISTFGIFDGKSNPQTESAPLSFRHSAANIYQQTFILANGTKTTFTISGQGAEVCYIVGPGSFYVNNLLAAGLDEQYTFVTCDEQWTRVYQKGKLEIEESKILITKDYLQHEHLIIQLLKTHFSHTKVALMGFSGPGCIAAVYAAQYPENVSRVHLCGVPLDKIDPSFANSDRLFSEQAPLRHQKYEAALGNYQKLIHGEEAKALPTTNFIGKGRERRLSFNSDWIEFTCNVLFHKAIDKDNSKHWQAYYDHWKANCVGRVIHPTYRDSFFKDFLPQLDMSVALEALNDHAIPVQLFNSLGDFVTPLSISTAHTLKEFTNVTIINYENCGHCPYIEKLPEFKKDVIYFANQHQAENKTNPKTFTTLQSRL